MACEAPANHRCRDSARRPPLAEPPVHDRREGSQAHPSPSITIEAPKNARTGFFEADDFAAVLAELPDYLKPVMQFAYYSGWRVRSEVLPLHWSHVDRVRGVAHLDAGTTKNGEARALPYTALPGLTAVIDAQRAATTALERSTGRIIPYVFHRNGQPIEGYKRAWGIACDRAAHGGRPATDRARSWCVPSSSGPWCTTFDARPCRTSSRPVFRTASR